MIDYNKLEQTVKENHEKNLEATNWVKVSQTRRRRGYTFEDKIRKKVNELDGQYKWHCRRLGGSSTGLPDLVITFNDHMGYVVAMECKSTKDKYVLEIPGDQVQRCIDTLDVFSMYGCMGVGFGFYFAKSFKCKRAKPIECYWLFTRYDKDLALDPLRGFIQKVTFDSRVGEITFWYTSGEGRTYKPHIANGYIQNFDTLVQVIKDEASHFQQLSHNENQTV